MLIRICADVIDGYRMSVRSNDTPIVIRFIPRKDVILLGVIMIEDISNVMQKYDFFYKMPPYVNFYFIEIL